jgi:hypothetical protein
MNNAISEKVLRWSAAEQGDVDFNALHALIEYLSVRRYDEYTAMVGANPNFRTRLVGWLDNGISDADQKLLFQTVPYLFFVGHDEIKALQRSAFRTPIIRWIIEQTNLRFDDPNFDVNLRTAINRTWFCPITDSAHITEFCHLNDITGANYRPDWRSYAKMHPNDATALESLMQTEGYDRVVLTEDIVASGSQMNDLTPIFAVMSPAIPILIAPLIVCPAGLRVGDKIATTYKQVSFSPMLPLPVNSFVTPIPNVGEPDFFQQIRSVASRIHSTVSNNAPVDPDVTPYGPFGFSGTGAVIVMYSNTPDNSLPLIHYQSPSWTPLFPRRSRI